MIRLPLRSLLKATRPSSSISKTFVRLSSTAGSSVPSSPGYPVAIPVESKDTTNIADTIVPQSELQKNQSPNRSTTWSRSQRPRSSAMVGPRFEQTDLEVQPRPYAAIELAHEQPVRWSPDRVVVCDGGGGPAGHPKVYINVDKPEVVTCNYCSLPFAYEHHKEKIIASGDSPFPILE